MINDIRSKIDIIEKEGMMEYLRQTGDYNVLIELRKANLPSYISPDYRNTSDYLTMLEQGFEVDPATIPFDKFNQELYYKLYEKNGRSKYPHVFSEKNFEKELLDKDIKFLFKLPNDMLTQEMLEDYLMIFMPNASSPNSRIVSLLERKGFKWTEEFAIQYIKKTTSIFQARLLPESILTPQVLRAAYYNEHLYKRISSYKGSVDKRGPIVKKILELELELKFLDQKYDILENNAAKQISTIQEELASYKQKRTIISTILYFVGSDCKQLSEYCLKKGLNAKKIQAGIRELEVTDPEIYTLYTEYIRNNGQNDEYYISEVGNKVMDYIRNGVMGPNGRRKMTIIDYYKLSSSPIDDVIKFLYGKANGREERAVVNQLWKFRDDTLRSATPKDRERMKKEIKSLSFRNPAISDEDRDRIIQYLDDNNIPISIKIFIDTYKLYETGEIDLSERIAPKIKNTLDNQTQGNIRILALSIDTLQKIDGNLRILEQDLQEAITRRNDLQKEHSKKRELIINGQK